MVHSLPSVTQPRFIYTVNNPISVPAGTTIRFEIANIIGSSSITGSYQVTITTRDNQGTVIDSGISPVFFLKMITGNNILAGSIVGNSAIMGGTVTSGTIGDQSILSYDIKDKTINFNQIADKTIGTSQIADKGITSAKIADKAIGTSQIADKAIGTSQIADKAIGTSQIADKAIGTSQIADTAIGPGQIGGQAILAPHIRDNTITGSKISTGFMKKITLNDDITGKFHGWDPDGSVKDFVIKGISDVGTDSSIVAHTMLTPAQCMTTYSSATPPNGGQFALRCGLAPSADDQLVFVVINAPSVTCTQEFIC
jgi:hypothetical protein